MLTITVINEFGIRIRPNPASAEFLFVLQLWPMLSELQQSELSTVYVYYLQLTVMKLVLACRPFE